VDQVTSGRPTSEVERRVTPIGVPEVNETDEAAGDIYEDVLGPGV
jgi:hypothetical protein